MVVKSDMIMYLKDLKLDNDNKTLRENFQSHLAIKKTISCTVES